ncbi:MAG: dihydroorotase [Betaproteobacteria bacterium]
MKIEIRNGHIVDPRNGVDLSGALYIAAGRIVAQGVAPDGWHPNRVIDATGLVVAPGLVDLSVRLREPGFEYKATLQSEMRAAVAGGVTSLACPPDTDPVLDEPGLVEMLTYRARSLSLAHLHPLGALTQGLRGEQVAEMGALTDAGCIGFSHADAPLPDTLVLYRTMQYAATFGYTVWLRPQDPFLARDGVAHDGEVATRLGLPAIPSCAETIALATITRLMEETGARIHLCRLSTREAVGIVRAAKKAGLPITCDVSAHHLHLCDIDIGYFDTNCRLVPPLRGTRDRDALRSGIADGTIDAICSDHAPVDDDAKQVPFGEAEPGVTAVELLLPLALKLAQENKLSLVDTIRVLTSAPARIMAIDAGHLATGQIADICIFDHAAFWRVERTALRSQGKNTPFLGMEVPGKVRYTLVNGQVVFEG